MNPADRAIYIAACLQASGMSTADARAFLAEHDAGVRAEVLAEATDAIETARAADEAMHRDEPAQINRRVGMREAMALLRRIATTEPHGKDTREGESPRATAPHRSHDELSDRQKTVIAPGLCEHNGLTGGPCPDHPRPVPPHEDMSLPPQLREALRIMDKRGPVVELTAPTGQAETAQAAPEEPCTPAQQAAREIQALHDPIVIGYIIGVDSLRLTLHPSTWQEWQRWQGRLGCPPGTTTYRGGVATARGHWGDVPVNVTCHLDRLPKAVEAPQGGDAL